MITTKGQLYQWDIGRIIEARLLKEQSIDEIHVYNGTTDYAIILDTWTDESKTKTYAKIPDLLLQSDNNMDIYVITTNEFGKHTTKHINVPVITRAKPDDYVYTEEELKTYARLEKRIEELGGMGKILPEVTEEDAGKVLTVSSEGKWVADILPIYTDDYTVIPKVRGQTLETKGKLMSEDLVVNPIPIYSTGNNSGGETVFIAKEI